MTDQQGLHTFAPHEAANIVGITATSVRRWVEYHSAFISESGKAEKGTPRRLTWGDIDLLKQVKAMRDQGLTVETINAMLERRSTLIEPLPDAPVTTVTPPVGLPAQQVEQYPMLAVLARVEALEKSSRAGWWWLVAGIGIGLGLALVFELAALVASRVR